MNTARRALRGLTGLSPQARVYIALAVFNVLSAAASVTLCHALLVSFSDSVATNRAWADRLESVARLGKLTGDTNAPGNDVFESHDVRSERSKEEIAKRAFLRQSAYTQQEIRAALPPPFAAPLLAKLTEADEAFVRMDVSADEIFDALSHDNASAAGSRMAMMDQAFADVRRSLDDVRRIAGEAQAEAFVAQARTASRVRTLQYVIAVTVILVIGCVTAYGLRLAAEYVRARRELLRKTDDMKLVFDNVAQGLLTVDREGKLDAERSRMVDQWFGPFTPGADFGDYLASGSEERAASFQLAFQQLVEGILPNEVCLEQMPKRILVGSKSLRIEYTAVYDARALLEKVVVVLSDVTAEEERARAAAGQQEALSIFERVRQDREGFVSFYSDASEKVAQLVANELDRDETLHVLHTVKGNCGVAGQASLATYCHELERALVENAGGLDGDQRRRLGDRWETFAERVRRMLGTATTKRITVDEDEYIEVVRVLGEKAPYGEILARVLRWRQELAQTRLEGLAEHATDLAARLGKIPLLVDVDAAGLRLPLGSWQSFFASLVHAVRNAVVHGIEAPEERAARGKDTARIALRAREVGDALVVEVEDTGRGIDWERLVECGQEHGLPVDSEEDRLALLFKNGVSTARTRDDLAGRGVGMGALKRECEQRGGRVVIESRPHEGTLLRFVFPPRSTGGQSPLPSVPHLLLHAS